MTARWENEKGAIDKVKSLKEQINAAHAEFENAQRRGELERAAQLKYETILGLRKGIVRGRRDRCTKANGSAMIHNEVNEEHIAQVVSKWTGIPVSRLMSGQRQRLMQMEDEIRTHVVGTRRSGHGGL